MKTSVQYKFTDIQDLSCGDKWYVIAVVKYFQNAEKTKGRDFKMTISITDPSLGYDKKLICNIFKNRLENFPRISSRGDVIVIHRLKIESYRDKLQGVGIKGFDAAVFSRDDSDKLMNCSYENHVDLMKMHSGHFNLSKEDFEKVQTMMVWSSNMPLSQQAEEFEEVNIDSFQFSTLSAINVGETVCLALQIVSVISVDYPPYQTIILVWDATHPSFQLNKNFINCIPQATSVKHSINLMAKFGGKLSDPLLTCIMFTETMTELKQSFIRPGDLIYLTRVSVTASNSGPGVLLIGDQCRIGPLPQDYPLFQELSDRINNFSRHTPCVADCISADVESLKAFNLQDFCKLLTDMSGMVGPMQDKYQFKITAKVANVHPSTEKEFRECLLMCCTCCGQFVDEGSSCEGVRSKREMVAVPMVTVILEDFTGWMATVMVGRAVMGLMSLVMIDASKPQWWAQALDDKRPSTVRKWLDHLSRLKQGWIEGKLLFKLGSEGKLVPYVEDVVILDYC